MVAKSLAAKSLAVKSLAVKSLAVKSLAVKSLTVKRLVGCGDEKARSYQAVIHAEAIRNGIY